MVRLSFFGGQFPRRNLLTMLDFSATSPFLFGGGLFASDYGTSNAGNQAYQDGITAWATVTATDVDTTTVRTVFNSNQTVFQPG